MSILITGTAVIDKIMNIDELPKKGDDIVCHGETVVVGGCGYNISSVLKNFDIKHDLVVPVGSGINADIIENQLKKEGYEIFIKEESQDNGYCMCLVEEDGERTFITVPGIESRFKREWLDSLDTKKYNSVYVSGYELDGENGKRRVDFLEENKDLELYFAPCPRICHIDEETMDRIFKLNPIVHLNDKEAMEYTKKEDLKECLLELYRRCNNTVFITLGEKGCLYIDKNKIGQVDAYETEVVDTIGAGDSHIATIMATKSMGYDIETSVRIANKVAAKVVATKGAKLDEKIFDKGEYLRCN